MTTATAARKEVIKEDAMLIQKETWERSGLPDERLGSRHEDLDYCWRARVAGDRVVWTPLAEVRHLGAGAKGVRIGEPAAPRKRFEEERAALASVLKNYALVSLTFPAGLVFCYPLRDAFVSREAVAIPALLHC